MLSIPTNTKQQLCIKPTGFLVFILVESIEEFENKNMDDIVKPVDADKLKLLLEEVGYDRDKTIFLYKGFKKGFSLNYQGNLGNNKRLAPNLKLRVGSKVEIWNKVMKEVSLGRHTGPFKQPPFEHFVQSPIGLVPKDKGKKTRLIFHLSYHRSGESVNSGIPKDKCTVKYPDFEEAIKLCLRRNCNLAKSDMSSAFTHVPLNKDQWYLLVMKATHPRTGETCFLWTNVCHSGAQSAVQYFRLYQME